MVSLARRLDITGRRVCVLSAPGDRRDEDIQDVARAAAAGNFDHIIVRRDDDPRGRGPTEVPNILRETLIASGVAEEKISIIVDEQQAIEAALRMGQRGDLVLIFGDKPSRCWKQIIYFKPEGSDPLPAARDHQRSTAGGWQRIFWHQRGARSFSSQSMPLISDERGVRLAQKSDD